MSEQLIVVDEHTNEQINTLPRKEVIEQGHWARSTNVFVLDRHGRILCHQRSKEKERHPGAWSTHFGGHVTHDETYEVNAQKELHEEIGLDIPQAQLLPWRTTKLQHGRLWVREFMTIYDGDISELKLQSGEIDAVEWYTADEILHELHHGPDNWLAGMHDFNAEYQCLRAVLTAGLWMGVFDKSFQELEKWHPPTFELPVEG